MTDKMCPILGLKPSSSLDGSTEKCRGTECAWYQESIEACVISAFLHIFSDFYGLEVYKFRQLPGNVVK